METNAYINVYPSYRQSSQLRRRQDILICSTHFDKVNLHTDHWLIDYCCSYKMKYHKEMFAMLYQQYKQRVPKVEQELLTIPKQCSVDYWLYICLVSVGLCIVSLRFTACGCTFGTFTLYVSNNIENIIRRYVSIALSFYSDCSTSTFLATFASVNILQVYMLT